MATDIWVNIGSGNGLLPDGTKPLPEPMWTDHQWSPVIFILGQFHMRMPQPSSITKIRLKIAFLEFHSNFPGANELNARLISPLHTHWRQHSVAPSHSHNLHSAYLLWCQVDKPHVLLATRANIYLLYWYVSLTYSNFNKKPLLMIRSSFNISLFLFSK